MALGCVRLPGGGWPAGPLGLGGPVCVQPGRMLSSFGFVRAWRDAARWRGRPGRRGGWAWRRGGGLGPGCG